MRADVARDLKRSKEAMLGAVWPEIAELCGGGRLLVVEGQDEKSECDQVAGIDYWQVLGNGRTMRGIATRVQFVAMGPWPSFTIRKTRASGARTEWEKRREAVLNQNEGWLCPHLTIQAYVGEPDGSLLYACGIETVPFYQFCLEHPDELEERPNPQDGNLFTVVWCRSLVRWGVGLWTWDYGMATVYPAGPPSPLVPVSSPASTNGLQGEPAVLLREIQARPEGISAEELVRVLGRQNKKHAVMHMVGQLEKLAQMGRVQRRGPLAGYAVYVSVGSV